MAYGKYYNPLILARLESYFEAGDWDGLAVYLDSLSHREFRMAGEIISVQIMPRVPDTVFWEAFRFLLVYHSKAFLVTLLKSVPLRKQKSGFTLRQDGYVPVAKFLNDAGTELDRAKFIRFMVDCGVLTFGSFTLKSGRQAPYFINTGNYKTGKQLAQLGKYYAACMKEHGLNPDTLFGPAYKGIPLATSAAVALATEYDQEVGYCFDRKEVKDHGEGGMFVGKKLADGDKVVIIEDVMTSGKAMAEVYPKLTGAAKVDIIGMVITVDRMEKALQGNQSAVQTVYETYGVPVYAIVNMEDIIAAIQNDVIPGKEYLDAMLAYREQYGVKA